MSKAKTPRPYRVGVYRHKTKTGRMIWSGYTRYVNEQWTGFMGWYEVLATCWRDAVSEAIRAAKREYARREEIDR